ncbi:MAG TPA: sigma factor-like helix-turn-helix DNA-binding protein, partial [Capsulimonadaceae bacterium]|nr:sigma factor-like helix-turn-helix DNA-binding protein [Capsulimonadaceae bacterium]
LSGLTPEHRDVVILHELQELTYSECAGILRIPVGTVKSRLFYAFRSLKGSLAAYVQQSDPCPPTGGRGTATGAATETIS